MKWRQVTDAHHDHQLTQPDVIRTAGCVGSPARAPSSQPGGLGAGSAAFDSQLTQLGVMRRSHSSDHGQESVTS